MVQCCPTEFAYKGFGDSEVMMKKIRANFYLAFLPIHASKVEGSRGTVLSRRVRTTAWKDPMVQCCPIGCTSKPGSVKSDGAKEGVGLDVCIVVLIVSCSRIVKAYSFDVVVAASVLTHVSLIMFHSIVNQKSEGILAIVSNKTVKDLVTDGMSKVVAFCFWLFVPCG